jgi:hypothetical protein
LGSFAFKNRRFLAQHTPKAAQIKEKRNGKTVPFDFLMIRSGLQAQR